MTPQLAARGIEIYQSIPIRFVDVDLTASLMVASEHLLHAYDAYLIECCRVRRAALLTLDRALALGFEGDAGNGSAGDVAHERAPGQILNIGGIDQGQDHGDKLRVGAIGAGFGGHGVPEALTGPQELPRRQLGFDQIH